MASKKIIHQEIGNAKIVLRIANYAITTTPRLVNAWIVQTIFIWIMMRMNAMKMHALRSRDCFHLLQDLEYARIVLTTVSAEVKNFN